MEAKQRRGAYIVPRRRPIVVAYIKNKRMNWGGFVSFGAEIDNKHAYKWRGTSRALLVEAMPHKTGVFGFDSR
jgi:hypothetical protein